jgi:hypothetical protein
MSARGEEIMRLAAELSFEHHRAVRDGDENADACASIRAKLRAAIEALVREAEQAREALIAHRADLHNYSTRPCPTCLLSARALGIWSKVPSTCADMKTDAAALALAREAEQARPTLPLEPSDEAVTVAIACRDFDGAVAIGGIPTVAQTHSLVRNKLRAAYRIDARYGGAEDGDPWLPATTLFLKGEITAAKLAELAGLKPTSRLTNLNLAALCMAMEGLEEQARPSVERMATALAMAHHFRPEHPDAARWSLLGPGTRENEINSHRAEAARVLAALEQTP